MTRSGGLAAAVATVSLTGCTGRSGGDPDVSDANAPKLRLEQKIGQMVMLGFAGTRLDDPSVSELCRQIDAGHLGGVVFYRYNVESPSQTRALADRFHASNPFAEPLLVAVDQEGGRVQRLSSATGFVDTPSAEQVRRNGSADAAYATYGVLAGMVAGAGFTMNLGPVVDLRADPASGSDATPSPVIGGLQRAFDAQPAVVVEYARSFVRAHRDIGVLTALKHYPGHGLASTDSHLGLVDVTETMRPAEREPFRSLIREGYADAVLNAHLVHRGIDASNPLTLSENFLKRELRGTDGFDGVLITDDLMMGAIVKYHSFEDSVIRSIRAGNDLMIFSNNPAAAKDVEGFRPRYDLADTVIDVVLGAIRRGEITEARINESWRRLRSLRSKATSR